MRCHRQQGTVHQFVYHVDEVLTHQSVIFKCRVNELLHVLKRIVTSMIRRVEKVLQQITNKNHT